MLLNYIDNRLKFWVTWPFALAGAIICWIFVADLTGMDLMEQASAAVSCTTVCQLSSKHCAACNSQPGLQDVVMCEWTMHSTRAQHLVHCSLLLFGSPDLAVADRLVMATLALCRRDDGSTSGMAGSRTTMGQQCTLIT